MAVMVRELYDALKTAGVPDDTANKAAEAVADTMKPMADMRVSFAELAGKVTLLQWMVGFNTALTMAVLVVTFRLLERLP